MMSNRPLDSSQLRTNALVSQLLSLANYAIPYKTLSRDRLRRGKTIILVSGYP